ncbi:transposase [Corynebacterium callunae DSM 20147]|uniref:Transposase n=2 Tax=Corynebacterium callunae TaxID=1721 RepID=M1UCJ3_9CORY|nr:transposase [Corynebacterium callunae]AGG65570.1 transposase [Corynebacterium callunae DSM 20147]
MTWWAQRSALPRTRRVGRCRGGCAGGRCCTCRSGIRTALPDARIAVDKWHLVALANLMVTQVRQRITRQLHGRRGTATDKVWASRQLLLTGYEHLTVKQKARFNAALAAEDPTNEIAAAQTSLGDDVAAQPRVFIAVWSRWVGGIEKGAPGLG